MKWVDQAVTRPFRCAVLPYVGNGSGHMFLDTAQDLDLEHVYISDVACEAIAQALGWVPKAESEREIDALKQRIAELEAGLAAAAEFAAHVDGLTRAGMVVRKQPGRKPAKEKEEADAIR